jgi:hypothetical protein
MLVMRSDRLEFCHAGSRRGWELGSPRNYLSDRWRRLNQRQINRRVRYDKFQYAIDHIAILLLLHRALLAKVCLNSCYADRCLRKVYDRLNVRSIQSILLSLCGLLKVPQRITLDLWALRSPIPYITRYRLLNAPVHTIVRIFCLWKFGSVGWIQNSSIHRAREVAARRGRGDVRAAVVQGRHCL